MADSEGLDGQIADLWASIKSDLGAMVNAASSEEEWPDLRSRINATLSDIWTLVDGDGALKP